MDNDPYNLNRLHDLARPDPVSWWPPAVGWWFVFALAGCWILITVWLQWLRWRRNAYRRAALSTLDHVPTHQGSSVTAAFVEVSALLKRVAIAAYPRRSVASLSGRDWRAFLEHTGPAAGFEGRPGELLTAASSETIDATTEDLQALRGAARRWILEHDPGAHNADF